MQKERQRHRQRKKQAPHKEPDAGLNPRTPGSRPEPKADAQLLSHSGVPVVLSFKSSHFVFLQSCVLKHLNNQIFANIAKI